MHKGYFKNKNILVTGASGLLGPWLIKQLLADQAQVITLVRDAVPTSLFFTDKLNEHVSLVWGDLQDFPLILR
ncbi:NAD-dependent epimerase/dehydratase family protein, partial [Candidatus Dependentiae bacterium]|nr:NAD-dependent epimerase/dehydratase family protein [Candidatus Dependentiae bacterium]